MAIFADRQNQIWWLTAILELPPSWNDGAVARNPGVSWAFLFWFAMGSLSLHSVELSKPQWHLVLVHFMH